MRKRKIRRSATVLVAVVLCSACSPSGNPGQEAITPDAVAREFREEQANLTLAPGWTWPDDPTPARTSNIDGKPVVYERGYGIIAADHYWYCSWESYYLSLESHASERRKVYDVLVSVRQTRYYKESLEVQDQAYFDKELEAAGNGDLSMMKEDVDLNCPQK